MNDQLRALYDLQELDVRIAQIRQRLAGLSGAKALKQRLAAARANLEAAQSKLTQNETELKDNELKLQAIDEKRSKFEQRLYHTVGGSTRELQAVEKEVNLLKAQQGQLDGRVLELYDIVESGRREAQAAQVEVDRIEKELSDALAHESQEHDDLEKELADLAPRREAAAARITDRHLMSRYEAVKKSVGTGIAKVSAGKCGGCHISITAYVLGALRKDGEFQSCESCGRILLLDEG